MSVLHHFFRAEVHWVFNFGEGTSAKRCLSNVRSDFKADSYAVSGKENPFVLARSGRARGGGAHSGTGFSERVDHLLRYAVEMERNRQVIGSSPIAGSRQKID